MDQKIKFRSLVPVTSKQYEEYFCAWDDILRKYNLAEIHITRTHCNGEFKPMMEDVQDKLQVTMKYAPANKHMPEAERNNRTMKEGMRTLRLSGAQKVGAGHTTISEVLRVAPSSQTQ